MVQKSYGKKRRTRHKLKLTKKATITKFLQTFNDGEHVHIKISTNKNIPHPKFQGLSGTVIGRRGRAYAVSIYDKNAKKVIFVKPEHMRKR